MNGSAWKWVATTAIGFILMLAGGALQRAWTDKELSSDIESLERQILQLTVTVSGDSGYGARIADHENRVRRLELDLCP